MRDTYVTVGHFIGGRRVATTHHRHAHTGEVWEEIEARAEAVAARHGAEVDIRTACKFPSGKVASWDRAGIRVRAA